MFFHVEYSHQQGKQEPAKKCETSLPHLKNVKQVVTIALQIGQHVKNTGANDGSKDNIKPKVQDMLLVISLIAPFPDAIADACKKANGNKKAIGFYREVWSFKKYGMHGLNASIIKVIVQLSLRILLSEFVNMLHIKVPSPCEGRRSG